MKLLLVAAAIIAAVNSVNGQSCLTPSGGSGLCIVIQQCAPLLKLVNKSNRTPAEFDLLRKSACGFEGNAPKVCCPAATPSPQSCFTPNGDQGTCVSIYSCPHLAAMLRPPVSKENMQFVQRSACKGSDQYSVCCGPATAQPVEKGNCAAKFTAAPPDPRTECCGIDSGAGNKIVGGTETSLDQYPWLTVIEYVQNNKIKTLCGGSLISSRYVLTAAHCLVGAILNSGTPKNVRLGEYDTSNNEADCMLVDGGGTDCADPVVIIPIEKTIPHAQYDPQKRQHDIGMIRLSEPAQWTDFIRPICLPTEDITLSPPPGIKLWAAGWGYVNSTMPKSNIKLHVDLPLVSQKVCQDAYSTPKRKSPLGSGQLCAGGEKDKDSCKGDSGGPLMYENGGRIWELVGLVSYGPTPCGAEFSPGVYTKTYAYISWIRANIAP